MNGYFLNINAQVSGEHEIHKEECAYCKKTYNFVFIGYFSNDKDALSFAKVLYPNFEIDGCAFCCKDIHKK